MDMQRRNWLRAWGVGACGAALNLRVLAAPAVQERLLVVFLRGGYDAINTLIPSSSEFYYRSRPHIGLKRPGSGEGAALALTADWALHPALGTSLLPMWQRKRLAFVPFSGLESTSRSHFEMQDKIELGLGMRTSDFSSGYLNRLVAELPQADAVSFTGVLTPILRGPVDVPNVNLLRAGNKRGVNDRNAQLIAQMYQGTALASTVQEGFSTQERVAHALETPASPSAMAEPNSMGGATSAEREMLAASRGAAAPGSLVSLAPQLARLLTNEYRVAFIDVGRWDTHVNQGAATGALADRLTELGNGLAVLERQMGAAWQHTTVVVMSEFGRTFRENGNRGTDHGQGSAMWVMGGAVRGGQVLGQQVPSEERTLHENRDWPVLNDYRAVLGGLFGRLYGLKPAALERIFPGVKPVDVGLI